jgi:hypothetical protein
MGEGGEQRFPIESYLKAMSFLSFLEQYENLMIFQLTSRQFPDLVESESAE